MAAHVSEVVQLQREAAHQQATATQQRHVVAGGQQDAGGGQQQTTGGKQQATGRQPQAAGEQARTAAGEQQHVVARPVQGEQLLVQGFELSQQEEQLYRLRQPMNHPFQQLMPLLLRQQLLQAPGYRQPQQQQQHEHEGTQQQQQQRQEREGTQQQQQQQKRLRCPYCAIQGENARVDVATLLLKESADGSQEGGGAPEEKQMLQEDLRLRVVDCFWRCFSAEQANLAVAAIHSLGYVVLKSKAQSALQLFIELRAASDELDAYVRRDEVLLYIHRISGARTVAPLRAFLIEQSIKFAARIARSKQLIADRGKELFVKDHMVILTHGRSSCVEKLLLDAWKVHHKRFSVIVTRYDVPTCNSFTDDVDTMVRRLAAAQIPAVATSMSKLGEFIGSIDFVIVGTEAVAGDGGVLTGVGTATTALAARQHKVPFYVACEACKFRRSQTLQPLDARRTCDPSVDPQTDFMWSKVPLDYRKYLDYTRPELISLLFTDVGVFAPRYVTFEMSKLFGIP